MKRLLKAVAKRIRFGFKWIFIYHKFGKIGIHSNIKKALIVKDVKNVFIGDYFLAEPGLRIQTYNRYNEQLFSPKILIGNHVGLGQFVEIIATDELIIEDGVAIGQFAMINTSIHGYMEKDVPILEQKLISKPIHIGKGSAIGMGACILPGADIGKYCYIGANCVINKKIPDYTIVSMDKPRMATMPFALRKTGRRDL